MELDKIITGDSAVVLQSFPPDCIDLTVTSPPYDNLRTYNGFTFDFETIARQLFRVTKAGGVVVWVVGDATVNGSETGTSFKQALYFMQCGFNLHDTMIYQKSGMAFPDSNRYHNVFEYMFVFSKGKPTTTNIIKDRPNKWVGKAGGNRRGGLCERDEYGARFNVWYYPNGRDNTSKDRIAFEHPAIFPEDLARDHIISWSNEGDVILDPFCGSGTTPKMASLLKRHYVGVEISAEYVALAEKRLAQYWRGLTPLALDAGDSPRQQALFSSDVFTPAEQGTTPAPRQ